MPAAYVVVGRVPNGGVPEVSGMTIAAVPSANFAKGCAVAQDAVTGLIDLCADDPPLIAGFALADNATALGQSAANSPATTTGVVNRVSVAVANETTNFMARLTNNSNTTVAPVAADRGQQYGLTRQTDKTWTVDKSKLGASARVIVTAIDDINNRVFFKVLKAYQQLSA